MQRGLGLRLGSTLPCAQGPPTKPVALAQQLAANSLTTDCWLALCIEQGSEEPGIAALRLLAALCAAVVSAPG